MRKPQSYRVLVVERGAKIGLLARMRAQMIVVEDRPRHWRVAKNTTGRHVDLKPR